MKTATIVPMISTMQPSDLLQVLEVERNNGQKSNHVHGTWSKKDFIDVLRLLDHHGVVVKVKEANATKVIAFVVFGLTTNKIHICNMVVHRDYEKLGIGSMLLDKLKAKKRNLEIDIRESNLNAQLFLKNQGFFATGTCRNWYENPQEDAYKFTFRD